MIDDCLFIENIGFTKTGDGEYERDGIKVKIRHRSVTISNGEDSLTFFRRKERYLWRFFIQRLIENDDWNKALDELYKKFDDIILLMKVLA